MSSGTVLPAAGIVKERMFQMNGTRSARASISQTEPHGRRPPIGEATSIANVTFSLCAAAASLLIAILAAAKGVPVVAIVWGLLAIGFVLRALLGRRRR